MFCQEYLIDLNGTQAAIRAGYAPRSANVTASQLLTKPNIQRRVQELFDARSKRVQVNQDYVLSVIVETIERCRQSVRPKLARDGEHDLTETPTGEGLAYVFDAANILRGTDQLGRHLKMFTDKVEHTGKDGGAVKLITASMDPKEAAQAYKELLAASQ
jgi:phage terminase small subunit